MSQNPKHTEVAQIGQLLQYATSIHYSKIYILYLPQSIMALGENQKSLDDLKMTLKPIHTLVLVLSSVVFAAS